ncbi:hypothetical protein MNBD_PLANCTO03-1597 [hydrothermal vent metagenome]|uniref:Uncharacterized protein n=1 Tax=hydrothermal vent metagenome TaxID=652676 RepID=A0A3B1DV79_9ZZZZ
MHILTKVFIVFAAVLSLVLAALTMAYSVNADAIVSKYNDAQQEAATAKAKQQAATAEYADAAAVATQQIHGLQLMLSDIAARNASLVTENASLTASVQAERNRADAVENQIGDSLQTTKAQASVIESFRQELSSLRESELGLRRASLELEDRVNDLASQNDVFNATIRALREQLASAQRAAELAMGGVSGAEGSPYEASGPVIRGRVTQVSVDPASGQPLIEVDIGSNDRVSENMQLHVGRGQNFVATLVVVRTDLQSAVARVSLTNAGSSIQPGDLVVSRFGR